MKKSNKFMGLALAMVFLFLQSLAAGQENQVRLIKHATPERLAPDKGLRFFEEMHVVKRFREVEISEEIQSAALMKSDAPILLNLFDDVHFTARIDQVESYVEGTMTITASLDDFPYSYMIFASTGDRSLVTIYVPERRAYYRIMSDAEGSRHYLLDLDMSAMEPPEYGPVMIPPEPDKEELMEQERIIRELEFKSTDSDDPVTIDVMIVYTPAARIWANTHGGGILNVVATAMATGQLVLRNSATVITLRLAHTQEIAYTESDSIRYDLDRFTGSSDGYMDAVHTLRNTFGADLCVLFNYLTYGPSGIGWLLNSTRGRPARAFSVTRIQAAAGFVPIHEMGHNMGCHHHKEQNHQPGPGLYSYAAGHRWTGSGGEKYCTVMTYASGDYFDDGVDHTQVPNFSFSIVNYEGLPTGVFAEIENARCIRNVKHVIAAYRSAASIDCVTCPGYEQHIVPISDWRTVSSPIVTGGCKTYRFDATAGVTYIFKTGCGDGATANFNTELRILRDNCSQLDFNSDGCESNRSEISWLANYDGYAYLRVSGAGDASGNFTLAYQRPMGCHSDLQAMTGRFNFNNYWDTKQNIRAGRYLLFNVSSGEQYHWSMCPEHGGDAPYNSQLTIRHGLNNRILAHSNNVCGDDARISWTSDLSGYVKLILTKFNCESDYTLARIAYKEGTLENAMVSVYPEHTDILPEGGTVSFAITSNARWEVSTDATWITGLIPVSGAGNLTFHATCLANTSSSPRTGTLTFSAPGVSDVVVTITQFPGDGYCNSLARSGSTPLTPANTWQYYSGAWAGQYVLFSVTKDIDYHWSLCPEHGGSAGYDSELTLRRSDTNAFIAYSNDACGDDATISWLATYTGVVKMIISSYSCEEHFSPTILAYKSGTLSSLSLYVSPLNREVLKGAGSTIYSLSSNASWDLSGWPDWITSVSPSSGKGGAIITVGYDANKSILQRVGTIWATASTVTLPFYLTQYPDDVYCNSASQKGGLYSPEENWRYLLLYSNEYAVFSVTSGTQYHWSLCAEHGASTSYDSELTLRRADNNQAIAYGDQECDDDARISWVADFTGEVKLVVTKYTCSSDRIVTRLAYKSGKLEIPYAEAVPSNVSVGPAEGRASFDIVSNTNWALVKNVEWLKLSQEQGRGNATVYMNYPPAAGSDQDGKITGYTQYGSDFSFYFYQFDYCNSTKHSGTGTPENYWQYIECIEPGNYAVFPVAFGERYHWSLCPAHGAEAPYTSQLTLRKLSDDTFVAFSELDCETGNDALITWEANFTGHVKLVVTKSHCQSQSGVCTRLGYKKGDLDNPYLVFSPSLRNVDHTAGNITFDLTSNTAWILEKEADWLSNVEPIKGKGNALIQVAYSQHTGPGRVAEITGTARGVKAVYFSLNQGSDVPEFPMTELLQNTVITTGEDLCFEAFQYISLAPWETYCIIEDGAVVRLVASESIHFYPGTQVHAGANLRAWITTDGVYCNGHEIKQIDSEDDPDHTMIVMEDILSHKKNGEKFFEIYPNPTRNQFTLYLTETDEHHPVLVEIYGISGQQVYRMELREINQYMIDMSGHHPGLYFIRLVRGQEAGVEKLVKL